MKSKFMKGMNLQEQKKCGILVTVIGLVMFAIGFLLGDAHSIARLFGEQIEEIFIFEEEEA